MTKLAVCQHGIIIGSIYPCEECEKEDDMKKFFICRECGSNEFYIVQKMNGYIAAECRNCLKSLLFFEENQCIINKNENETKSMSAS